VAKLIHIGAALTVFSLLWASPILGQKGEVNGSRNFLTFSLNQGFYHSPFYLDISSQTGDPVHYTLDGSLPTPNSDLLTGSIFLDYTDSKANSFSEIPTSPKQSLINYQAWTSPGKPVDKAHVIRCASFRDGIRTSPVYTRTYFVDEAGDYTYTLPVLSLVTDSLNLFDTDSGIYIPGNAFDPADPQWSGNYFQKGREWERQVHLEYFSKEGYLGLSQNAGFRIHGGMTRHAAQKTLRLYARDEYGPNYFNYPLFPQKSVGEYKRFLLRTTMGSWRGETIISDVLAHEMVRDLNIEIMDYQAVIVFLNGEYWGIHTLRDRVDERYIEYISGIDKDSVDMINANIGLIDAGSNEHYLNLAAFIEMNELSEQSNYEYVKTQIDISSFVDYITAEMFFANSDWPGNNQKLWRPQRPDGKWRWIFLDLDAAYDPGAPDIFKKAMLEEGEMEWAREPVSSFLLRNLLKNEQFTSLFIERFAQILNEAFTPEKIYRKLESIMSQYEEEVAQHSTRWHYPESKASWEQDIKDHLLDFLIKRPCEVAKQVIRYFDLEEFGFSCESPDELGKQLVIAPNPNNGNFYIWNNSQKGELLKAVLTDIAGKVVYVEENILLEAQEKKYYEFSALSGGMYYLSLISAHQYTVKPILVY